MQGKTHTGNNKMDQGTSTMTKSKRKRLRKNAAARSTSANQGECHGSPTSSAGVSKNSEDEEIIVIKTKGFQRNEMRDAAMEMNAGNSSYCWCDCCWSGNDPQNRAKCAPYSNPDVVQEFVDCNDIDLLVQYINGKLSKKAAQKKARQAKKEQEKNKLPNKKSEKKKTAAKNKKKNDSKKNDNIENDEKTNEFSKNTKKKERTGLIQNRA